MFLIDNCIVSKDLLDVCFSCDLKQCKGMCCVEGDAGAPLTEEETKIIFSVYKHVKPYLSTQNQESIENQGVYIKDTDGEYVTPLVEDTHCAYAVFDNNNIAVCAIEKAYNDGKIGFQKPISCHLYPVRILKNKTHEALNYHRWKTCETARKEGARSKIPVYMFVKDALIRKYGQKWFDEFVNIANEWETSKISNF